MSGMFHGTHGSGFKARAIICLWLWWHVTAKRLSHGDLGIALDVRRTKIPTDGEIMIVRDTGPCIALGAGVYYAGDCGESHEVQPAVKSAASYRVRLRNTIC